MPELRQHSSGEIGKQRRHQQGHQTRSLEHRIEVLGHLIASAFFFHQAPGGLVIEIAIGGDRQLKGCFCRGPELQVLQCGQAAGFGLQLELQGISCLPLEQQAGDKQETCVSRSFSRPVTTEEELRQAIASYISRGAEKLRRQRQRAGRLTVFARTSPFAPGFYSQAASLSLPLASNDTGVLLRAACRMVPSLYRPYKRFAKAGILLQDLQPESQLQHHLLQPLSQVEQQRREALMPVLQKQGDENGALITTSASNENPHALC